MKQCDHNKLAKARAIIGLMRSKIDNASIQKSADILEDTINTTMDAYSHLAMHTAMLERQVKAQQAHIKALGGVVEEDNALV